MSKFKEIELIKGIPNTSITVNNDYSVTLKNECVINQELTYLQEIESILSELDDDELEDLKKLIEEETQNRGESRFSAQFDWERTAEND